MLRGVASVRAKLDRGREHAEALMEKLRGELRDASLGGRLEIDPTLPRDIPWQFIGLPGLGCATFVLSEVPTVAPENGLLLGDVLHNYRGALDHLAWLIVARARPGLSAKAKRQVQFPLARTRASFHEQRKRQMPGISDEIWEFVERYQPYRRSPMGKGMRYLRNLSDTDKHRSLVPTIMGLHLGQFVPKAIGCHVLGARLLLRETDRIKVGTRMAQVFYAGGTPQRLVGLEAHLTLVPALAADVQLEAFLNGLDGTCREITTGLAALV